MGAPAPRGAARGRTWTAASLGAAPNTRSPTDSGSSCCRASSPTRSWSPSTRRSGSPSPCSLPVAVTVVAHASGRPRQVSFLRWTPLALIARGHRDRRRQRVASTARTRSASPSCSPGSRSASASSRCSPAWRRTRGSRCAPCSRCSSSYVMLGLFFAYLDSGIGHIIGHVLRAARRAQPGRTTRTSATSRSRPSASATSRPAPASRGRSSSSRRSSGRSSSSRSSRGWCRCSARIASPFEVRRGEEGPRGTRVTSAHGPALPPGRRGGVAAHPHLHGVPEVAPHPARARLSSTTSSPARTARRRCLRSLGTLYGHGRLGGTGYLSILPVDQGSSTPRPRRSRRTPSTSTPRGCATSRSPRTAARSRRRSASLGAVARRYVHRIPFIVKLNHNDFLHFPNTYDQVLFASVRRAIDLGAIGVGATIYFGSPESDRQLHEVGHGVRRGAPQRAVHRAVDVPAQPGVQEGRRRTTRCPRTSPGRPTTSA